MDNNSVSLSTATTSPQNFLADLFLDKLGNANSIFRPGGENTGVDVTFQKLLDKNFYRLSDSKSQTVDTVGSRSSDVTPTRRSPLEELKSKTESLGVPLSSVTLKKEDLSRVEKVLKDSGLDDDQVEKVMNQLNSGPLTMDRVMAVLPKVKAQSETELTLSEETKPLLGNFLQEMGVKAEEVKDILAGLTAGQKFGAEALRSILLQHSGKNLKGATLSQADQENLKKLLLSLGASSEDLKSFYANQKKTQGQLSMEGFLSFLKSIERPKVMSLSAAENVRDLLGNLQLNGASLKSNPYFNRIICLLTAMGDKEINPKFFSDNPAIQALRGQAASASSIVSGDESSTKSGADDLGQERGSRADRGIVTIAEAEVEAARETTFKKPEQATLSSKLSEALLKQVSEKMVYQVKNNQHQLKLQLNPPDLGRLNLNLSVKNNVVTASIVADNQMVKEALEECLASLREKLAEQGLELGKFDVSYRQGQQSAADERDRYQSGPAVQTVDLKADDVDLAALNLQGLNSTYGLVDRMI